MNNGVIIKRTRILSGITFEEIERHTGIPARILNDIELGLETVTYRQIEGYVEYLRSRGWTVDVNIEKPTLSEYVPEVENKFTDVLVRARKKRIQKQKEQNLIEQRLIEESQTPAVSLTGRKLRR